MAKGKLVGKAIKAISGKMSAKPKKPTKEQQKRTAERQIAAEKRRKEAMRGIVEDFKKARAKKKPAAAGGGKRGGGGNRKGPGDNTFMKKHNEAQKRVQKKTADTPQLAELQQKIREAAKRAGLTVKAYRQKNPNNPTVKKLYSLKPNIKSADALGIANKKEIARRRNRDAAARAIARLAKKKKGPKTGMDKKGIYRERIPGVKRDSKGNIIDRDGT